MMKKGAEREKTTSEKPHRITVHTYTNMRTHTHTHTAMLKLGHDVTSEGHYSIMVKSKDNWKLESCSCGVIQVLYKSICVLVVYHSNIYFFPNIFQIIISFSTLFKHSQVGLFSLWLSYGHSKCDTDFLQHFHKLDNDIS